MKKHLLKKALAIFVIFAMLIPCLPVISFAENATDYTARYTASSEWYTDDSTRDSDGAYVIKTAEDLAYFMTLSNTFSGKTVKLGADIVWNYGTVSADGFTPDVSKQGDKVYPWTMHATDFSGTFDGQGYTISGLYMTGSDLAFLKTVNGGTVQNVCFENCYISSTAMYTAVVASRSKGTATFQSIAIKNCYVTSSSHSVGGILAAPINTAEYVANIKNCTVDEDTVLTGSSRVGAFVGWLMANPKALNLENCMNYTSYKLVGEGGSSHNATFTNCITLNGTTATVFNGEQDETGKSKTLESFDNHVMTVEGVQTRSQSNDSKKFDARLVASVDFDGIVDKSSIKLVGFEMSKIVDFAADAQNAIRDQSCNRAYRSIQSTNFGCISVGTGKDEIDADYLATVVITDIPKNDLQTLLVRAYYEIQNGDRYYGGYAVITFIGGKPVVRTAVVQMKEVDAIAIACSRDTEVYDMYDLFEGASIINVKQNGEAVQANAVPLAVGENTFDDVSYVKNGVFVKVDGGVTILRRDKHRVVFTSNGGSYIATKYVEDGATITYDDSVKPTHVRYSTFTGWYNDAGEQVLLGKTPITSDIVLTARWDNLKTFGSNHSSYLSYTTSSAVLNIAWKDYDNAFGYRPESVTCTLSDGTNSYKVIVTKTTATFEDAKPTGATISQGAGNWTVKITGLTKDYTFEQDALNNEHYTTVQSGTAVEHTMVGYSPVHDDTAALMTQNGRLYDYAGNVIVLKGVVTLNVGWNAFPTTTSVESLTRLKNEGVNCIRVTMMTGSATDSTSTGYLNASKRASLMATLDTAIQTATALGMYCIVDFGILMTDSNYNNDAYLNNLKPSAIDLFETLAEDHISNPYVLFEICNEPYFAVSNKPWSEHIKPFEDDVIDAIRATGSKAVIIAATNFLARYLSDTNNDDPINVPFETEKSYNVAFSYHNYSYTLSYNNGTANHGWRLSDGIKAGLTIIATEFSPATASIEAQSTGGLLANTKEADKYLNVMLENDVSYMFFRFTAGDTVADTSSQHMFIGGNMIGIINGAWTYEMLSDCGKWFYDRTLGSTGFIKAADFTYVKPKTTTNKCAVCGSTEYCKICGLCTDCVTTKYNGICGGYTGECHK